MHVDSKPVHKWLVTLVAIGGFGLAAAACSDGDTINPNGCTPGEQSSCACPGGTDGVQVCSEDGASFGKCDCGGTSNCGNGALDNGEECDDGNAVDDDACTNQCSLPKCGDGIVQDGEDCDDGGQVGGELDTCPSDCQNGGGTGGGGGAGSGGGGTGGGGPTCADTVIFAGVTAVQPSAWSSGGFSGHQAGDDLCDQAHLGSHVCDYAEIRAAEAKADADEPILMNTATGTTIWINRTTPEMVNGTLSQPGAGGRCNDWVYSTNHISDGEYATFDTVGVPTYHLDNDTFFDGVDTSHTITGDLQCGGTMRTIPCCNPCNP